MKALGIIEINLLLPHPSGSVRIKVEFIVLEDGRNDYFILGTDYLNLYGFDIHNSKERFFTIGHENQRKKFQFLHSKAINSVQKKSDPNFKFELEQLKDCKISEKLDTNQRSDLIQILFNNKNAFATDKEPLGAIKGHEVEITLNIEKPYPPLLRRPAYPASPRAREALEKHITELIDLGVLRKIGHKKSGNYHTSHNRLAQ
ncbi:hypothetical protein PSHT_01020 [Puccinia striiformis]|uniref:Uncharacterized protein n=1 Tax=Puccinia striiformis TaxID=27350 RepID=A0A2S4WLK2_9BASI|nr:hypothetical protein PSHT_01020 [Puccinia striiformis]